MAVQNRSAIILISNYISFSANSFYNPMEHCVVQRVQYIYRFVLVVAADKLAELVRVTEHR